MLNERKLTKSELAKREDIVMDMKKNKRALVKKYGKDAEKVMYGRATNMAKKQNENMDDKKLNLRKMIEDALQNPKAADLIGRMGDRSLNENKSEAAYELRDIMDQLYELSDRAKQIIRSEFPSEYSRLDAYGALDFGTSSNRYDVTFEKALEDLEMYQDDDEDMMQEGVSKELSDAIDSWTDDERVRKAAKEYAQYSFNIRQGANPKNLTDPLKDLDDETYHKALDAYRDAKNIDEDLDLGHQDNEPGMLKGDLYKIGKYAMELYQMMDSLEGMGEVDLPHWWQSKIITAKNMVSGAKHYLDFEMKEPQIDAMVGVAAEEDVIDEGMSEEEWAKAKEEDRLEKLPMDQQAKIKKAIAMLKAEKKPKK